MWYLHRILGWIRYLKSDYRARFINNNAVDNDTILINPIRIKYFIQKGNSEEKKKAVNTINQKIEELNFTDGEIILSIKKSISKKIKFSETEFFKNSLEKIKEGNKNWECQSEKELIKKSNELNNVINCLIKKDSPKDLGNINFGKLFEKIHVEIDNNGEFILVQGNDYLAIYLLIGYKLVPVRIIKRHTKWKKFRNKVNLFSHEAAKGTYQPLIHPDLQSFPSHRKEDRWELILKNLKIRKGTMLDIGSNLGYFCHKFEDLGFNCYAVERNHKYLYFLKRLREIEKKNFEVIQKSVFDIDRKQYDVVLALSIFHHFLRTMELFNKMTKFLTELEIKYMFFEPPETGHCFKNSYVEFSEIEFVNYILEHSCLNSKELLDRGERGRPLYLLCQ